MTLEAFDLSVNLKCSRLWGLNALQRLIGAYARVIAYWIYRSRMTPLILLRRVPQHAINFSAAWAVPTSPQVIDLKTIP